MMKNIVLLSVGVALGASSLPVHSAEHGSKTAAVDISKLPPAADKKGVMFANDIKPIFDKSCTRCHGPEKPKARLRLDSLQAALKGGEDGKVIEPGESAKSMLVINVARIGDEETFMPPPRNKAKIQPLTKEEVGLVRAWIDQGAK
jgi:hypothetical protein